MLNFFFNTISSINSDANKIYTVRCNQIDGYDSLNVSPVLYSGLRLNKVYMDSFRFIIKDTNGFNSITFLISDDVSNAYGGIDGNIQFLIGLKVVDYDESYIDSKYLPDFKNSHLIHQNFYPA